MKKSVVIINCRVSHFDVRWRIDRPLQTALRSWRLAVGERRRWEERWAQARELQRRNNFTDDLSVSVVHGTRNARQKPATIDGMKRAAATVYFTSASDLPKAIPALS